ncbi:MAG TPA: hypothetical protein VN493_01265 [Thermoanaerobaculia bacterium]|nr:hypothetical protein [Thermoanaerobaculia bacterium]
MSDGFKTLQGRPVEPGIVLTPLRPATGAAPIERAAPTPELVVRRTFVNDEKSSRLPWAAALGLRAAPAPFEIAWRAPLEPATKPSSLLWWRDRVLVEGDQSWQLFSLDGSPVKSGFLGESGVVLDPQRSVFYFADSGGFIAAGRLSDGRNDFRVGLLTGKNHGRSFIAQRADRMITVSTRLHVDQHSLPPISTVVEVTEIGHPGERRSFGDPNEPLPVADLARETVLLLAAMQGGKVTLATNDRVYRADLDLKIELALTGSFTPDALSLDETGRIYLAVEAQGRRVLWLISPAGELLYSFELPPGFGSVLGPAVVGFDHAAYLLGERHVVAVTPEGHLKWARRHRGRPAGAVVTADDWLLVADGNELAAYDEDGQRHSLYTFPEPLQTAPLLTSNGEYLLATATHLYCLRP